jgi:hypothetical protein
MVIKLHLRKLVIALICIMIVLLVANLIGIIPVYNGTREVPSKLTSFNLESNLPTLFSTGILAICGLLAATIAVGSRENGKAQYFKWMGMAAVFFFLAIDETALFHERATHAVRSVVDVEMMGLSHAAWTIPYTALALLVIGVYWRFFWKLPVVTRWQFGSGVALYLTGAVVMEFVSCIWLDAAAARNAVFYLLCTVEESLEMIGVIVIIHALSRYLETQYPDLCLKISSGQEPD